MSFDPALVEKHEFVCKAIMSDLNDGPWKKEPHRVEWKAHGFSCLMVRHEHCLHWCGYVGLPPGHPDYGKHYDDVEVDVHGGLTYSERCDGLVCHRSDDEAPALWWLGFDCAHWQDLSPGVNYHLAQIPGIKPLSIGSQQTYKTLAWVKKETGRLAKQLKAMNSWDASRKIGCTGTV
jgi:hypothetical protein